ncbi:EamA family transporter [Enterobacter bugandensis]|uniref:EamA family transporter n=1 Tax=Enterobacter bugandensis TaxID=881260 RepID=UPI0020763348|nr:EamA family transporter [Enterobacter bugandensis]MCM7239194.1 EamA family transporter [Enterobacter bugandensis]MCM7319108.1 EamA family transporter [Enterobacter bugandensis]MCM7354565.1 EamA family transporter [Enterobacter bugandensis]
MSIKKNQDIVLGVLVTIMWGSNFSIIAMGLKDLDPFALTLLRFFFCAFPLIFFVKRPRDISVFYMMAYGIIFGSGLWWVVNFAIYSGLSAGLSSIFLQFSAFFTIILSVIFLKEKVTTSHLFGGIVSMSGLIMIMYCSDYNTTVKGVIYVLLAALAWSICNIIIKIKKPSDMLAFIIWSSLFSVPSVLVMSLWVKGIDTILLIPYQITWGSAFSVLFQAYVTTIIGYKIWNNLMKKHPSYVIAPLSLIVPVSGILTSSIFFDESFTTLQWIAVAIIILGISIFLLAGRTNLFIRLR